MYQKSPPKASSLFFGRYESVGKYVIFIFVIPHGDFGKKPCQSKVLTLRSKLVIRKPCFLSQMLNGKLRAPAICGSGKALHSQIIKKLNVVVPVNENKPSFF